MTRFLYRATDMLITVSQADSFAILTSSHYSLVSKISKPMGTQGMFEMYENAVRNLPSKYPKGITFSESATRPGRQSSELGT